MAGINNIHDTSNWQSFFDTFNVYTNSVRLRYFIDMISKYAKDSEKPLIELGSGSGATAKILSELGYSVSATDIDDLVIDRLKRYLGTGFDEIAHGQIFKTDMRNIDVEDSAYSVALHQGLLEHFSDEEIVDALREQGRVADYVVFDVPNNRDNEQHYGDERFLSLSHWTSLMNEAGLELVEYQGRMPPRWTYFMPHAFHLNKGGVFSLIGKKFGRAYIFVARKMS
jgi:trans-aconitate methyltransferase